MNQISTDADAEAIGKDAPLGRDIRLLGRMLGAIIRQQEGDAVFDVVERIRQLAVGYRRAADESLHDSLEATLNQLSQDISVAVVRAFGYFSHLANIAEGIHHNPRRRIHRASGSPPPASKLRPVRQPRP